MAHRKGFVGFISVAGSQSKGIAPSPAPEFADQLLAAKTMIERNNRALAALIEPFKEQSQSAQYIALALREDQMLGSFQGSSFVQDSATGWQLMTKFGATFSSQSAGKMVKLNGPTVREIPTTPCSDHSSIMFYVSKSEVTYADDQTLSIVGSAVTANQVNYRLVSDEKGIQWVCL